MSPGRRNDLLLARGLGAAAVVEVSLIHAARGPLALNVLTALLMAGAVAARRRAPLAALVGGVAVALACQLWLTPTTDRVASIVTIITLSYSVARWSRANAAGAGLGLALAGATAVSLLESLGFGDVLFPDVFFVWVPFLAGRTIRHRTGLADALADRAARLEREREQVVEREVLSERRRIARDLHDVVAHSISVMVVQAGAGRRMAERDPGRATECAAQIEQTGREALSELRRLLGMTRPEGESGAILAPQPSFVHLDDLVQNARDAGLAVEVRTSGEPYTLPPGVDLAAYRIAQEALINTLKHAGPVHARVLVTYTPEALDLEVSDDGPGTGPEDVAGHGLVGMRERAALCGGELTASRAPEGGYRVRARLPLADGATAASGAPASAGFEGAATAAAGRATE